MLVVEEEVRFRLQHICDAGFQDRRIVALEPLVPMLANIDRVVATLQRPEVVDNSEQRVPSK